MLLTSVFPVFAVIFLGWMAGRTRLMGVSASEALNGFVFYCALPVMLFKAMANTELETVLNPVIILMWIGIQLTIIALITLVTMTLFKRNLTQSIVTGLTAVFSNTGYMGIPLALAAFGEASLIPSVIVTVAQTALLIPAGLLLLDVLKSRENGSGGAAHALKSVASGVTKNPILLATFAGLLVSGLQVSLPVPIAKLVDIVAPAAGPCALFAIGLFLAGQKLRTGAGEVAMLSVTKLALHPLAVLLVIGVLAQYGFDLDTVTRNTLLIQAALPAGATAFVVAQAHQVSVDRASGTILVTTILSVASVSMVLSWLG